MAISDTALLNLARSVDLRIDALNDPSAPGQPQMFQIRPAAMVLSAVGDLFPNAAVLDAAIPVDISVKWGVEDAKGTPLGPEEAVTYSSVAAALETTVMVLPDFVELREGVELPVKTRYVTATVTLKDPADREGDGTDIQLVRHPISVPAIPIPSVALFFAKDNLGMTEDGELQSGPQFVLVMVPDDSPIASISALRFAFDKLREVCKTAAGLVELAGLAGSGLTTLIGAGDGVDSLSEGVDTVLGAFDAHALIGGRVGVGFVTKDSVSNLNDVDMILGPHIWNNDVEAEDTISSLALIGPPGRRIRCFQHRDFRGWNMSVTASDFCVTLVNKMAKPPVTVPDGFASPVTGPLDNSMSAVTFL
jgi:hypothetical protein